MAFKIGDKVRFLHEKGEGTVKKVISAYKLVVEITEGLDIEVGANELVAVRINSFTVVAHSPKDSGKGFLLRQNSRHHAKPHSTGEKVVDLHFDKIKGKDGHFDNSQKLKIQLDRFKSELDKAIDGHITKIIFVHGVGNGILRNSIRGILKGFDGIEYYDAPYKVFGDGATEVRIFARNKAR